MLIYFSFAFYLFAGINFLLAIFVFFFVPETKKVTLEEMDVLFGGNNHFEKGGDLLHIEDVHHTNVGPGSDKTDGHARVDIIDEAAQNTTSPAHIENR